MAQAARRQSANIKGDFRLYQDVQATDHQLGGNRRTLVLLSRGRNMVEVAGGPPADEPQPHWREVARLTGARIESVTTMRARHGRLFNTIFRRQPWWGVATKVLIDSNQYDRIYALDEDVGFRAALLLRARGWNGRLVCLVHNLSPARKRVIQLIGKQGFAHFFTYSGIQRNALIAAGIGPDRVTNAFIPADTGFFQPMARTEARQLVIAIGAADRDYELLFAAAPGIQADIEVYGHGYAGANAAGTMPAALPSNVKLMPHVSVAALRDRLGAANVAVLPLRPVSYAAGATVLTEAMAAGVPVVASDIPGLRDYLLSANPGEIVPPGDPASLASAVTRMLQDAPLARTIGKKNREWALANASVEDFAHRVVDALEGAGA